MSRAGEALYPGWEVVGCGCCNGVAWGGKYPMECADSIEAMCWKPPDILAAIREWAEKYGGPQKPYDAYLEGKQDGANEVLDILNLSDTDE